MSDLARRSYTGLGLFLIALAVLLFLPAFTLDYWQAWVYWLLFASCLLSITGYFLKRDPELVERRLNAGPTAEKERSQRVIQTVASVSLCLLFVLPGLDRHFRWSAASALAVTAGDVLTVLGFGLIFVVFRVNTYTSSRVEVDPRQTVISSGPYAQVRHPMYSGALLLFVGAPLALGSWWALLAVVPMAATLVWRLLDEERFLRRNLAGYEAYCARVRRHLIPGVW